MSIPIPNDEITEMKLGAHAKAVMYEKCFIPEKDPELMKAGIEVCAVTINSPFYNSIENKIIFRKGKRESSIKCIHTAICQLVKNPESETGFEVVSTENKPELKQLLSAEEHYFAIKSFTQALVENGIQESLLRGMKKVAETNQEPLDMNGMMRAQLTRALTEIAPRETKDLVLSTLEYISVDDPKRLNLFSRDFRDSLCYGLSKEDILRLDRINGGLKEVHQAIKLCMIENYSLDALPMDFIMDVAIGKEIVLKRHLASKQHLPNEIIEKLADENDDDIILGLARTQDLPDIIKRKIVGRNDYIDRSLILLQRNLPDDIIRDLTQSSFYLTRECIAKIPTLPNDVMISLANDMEGDIALKIAERIDITPEVMAILINNPFNSVREKLASNEVLLEKFYKQLSKDADNFVRSGIAGKVDLQPDIVRELAKDPSSVVREAISKRRDIPDDIIKNFAIDDSASIRHNISVHYGIDIFKNWNDPNYFAIPLDTIIKNPSKYMKIQVLKSGKNIPIRYLKVLAGDDSRDVREQLAMMRDLPDEIMTILVKDREFNVRGELAKRKDLPADIIEVLQRDPSPYVRKLLKSHLKR